MMTTSLLAALPVVLPLALLGLQATLNVPQLVRIVRAQYGGAALSGEALTLTAGLGWLGWSLIEADPAMAASAALTLLGFGPTTWMLVRAGSPWRSTAIAVVVVASACVAGLVLGGTAWLATALTALAVVQYGAYVLAACRCEDWTGFSPSSAALRVVFGIGWAVHGLLIAQVVLVVWGAMTVATFTLTASIALRSRRRAVVARAWHPSADAPVPAVAALLPVDT